MRKSPARFNVGGINQKLRIRQDDYSCDVLSNTLLIIMINELQNPVPKTSKSILI